MQQVNLLHLVHVCFVSLLLLDHGSGNILISGGGEGEGGDILST